MRVPIDGFPNSLHLQLPLFHVLANQRIKDPDRSLKGIDQFRLCLMVLVPLCCLSAQEILDLLPCRSLLANELLNVAVMLFTKGAFLGDRVVETLMRRFTRGSLLLQGC